MSINGHQPEPPSRNLLRGSIKDGWRSRLLYATCAAVAVFLGLASRRYGEYLPPFIAEYAGDTLWAAMVFLGVGVLVPASQLSHRIGIAISCALAVELSQLYKAPWIDAIRQTTLGGLVLGFGFLWTDLLCYAVGVFAAALLDYLAFGKGRQAEQTPTETA